MPEYNLKSRLLWCPHCKTDITTDKINAKCETCGETLITVLYSLMDGSRITGVEPFQLPPILIPGVR